MHYPEFHSCSLSDLRDYLFAFQPSVCEASHYALTAGLPFTTVAMRARKFSITYTRPASPLSKNLPQRPQAGLTAVNIYKTSPFQTPVGRRPCATIKNSAGAALKRR